MNSQLQTPVPSVWPSAAACGCGAEWRLLTRAQWNLAVLTELAEPGVMELVPVLADDGAITDFEWRRASSTSTLMLGCAGEDLAGRRLRHAFEDGSLGAGLFETYRRVFVSRSPQITQTCVGDWSAVHDVRWSQCGLVVRMTCASARERVLAARQAVLALLPAPVAGERLS